MSIKYNDPYYYLKEDIEKYPDAWAYIVWSQRGVGKTYGALWWAYSELKQPIVYMKRTKEDVQFITERKDDEDFSPYKPINRDKGTDIYGELIDKGIGVFYNHDGEDKSDPISYCLALSAAKKIKGFDLSECPIMLLDEFIPQVGEIVRKKEGEMLLDVYMTIRRDRVERGKPDLKLVLFANAENISTPITNTLEIVDDMAEMQASNERYRYTRGIMLHRITPEECPVNRKKNKVGIEAAMENTAWGSKAFGGNFANNDFTNIKKMSLKGMKPIIHIQYNTTHCYVYRNDNEQYYVCKSKNNCDFSYNLNKENDQKRFYMEWYFILNNACIEGRVAFSHYSIYDHIINYKDFFLTR